MAHRVPFFRAAAFVLYAAPLLCMALLAGCDSDDDDASPMDDVGQTDDPDGTSGPDSTEEPDRADDPSASGAVIDRDNHVELLGQAFGIYAGGVIVESLRSLRNATLVQTQGDEGYATVPAQYACVNGGTVQVAAENTWVFDGCQIGEAIHDGRIEAPFARFGWFVASEGLTIRSEPDRLIEFSGSAYRAFNQSINDSTRSWETTDVDFRTRDVSGTFAVEDADIEFAFGPNPSRFVGTLEGGFTMRSALTGDRPVAVMTTETFVYPEEDTPEGTERNFTSGVLRLDAGEGNTLVFDVGNGDEDSVSIALTVEGETEEFVQPWSLWPDLRL